jgi:hypothetical protein
VHARRILQDDGVGIADDAEEDEAPRPVSAVVLVGAAAGAN